MRRALERAATELNQSLAKTQGRITNLDANIYSGVAGAIVRLIIIVDERDFRPKRILWANETGSTDEKALRRAREKINVQLAKLRGETAGFYLKFITPMIPKHTYATLIIAVNEELPEKVGKLSSGDRRERLMQMLRLVANNPQAINLAQVAKIFDVSRDTIYRDLEELGIKR